jgi:hypothetical protein
LFVCLKPLQQQRKDIHLVIVTREREAKQLLFEVREPRSFRWKKDMARLEVPLLVQQPGLFVILGVSSDDVELCLLPQNLSQARAGARVFDDDQLRLPFGGKGLNAPIKP